MPDVADEFEWLYDEAALQLIDRQQQVPVEPAADVPNDDDDVPNDDDDVADSPGLTAGGLVKRYGMLGAMGARSMLGLAEVIEPERSKPTIIEFAPDKLDEDEQLVTFVYVPGDPQASRLIIRPWLRRRSA